MKNIINKFLIVVLSILLLVPSVFTVSIYSLDDRTVMSNNSSVNTSDIQQALDSLGYKVNCTYPEFRYGNSKQCYAFVLMVADKLAESLYGVSPSLTYGDVNSSSNWNNYLKNNPYTCWERLGKDEVSELKVGDVIRVGDGQNGHSAIVYSINGNTIKFLQTLNIKGRNKIVINDFMSSSFATSPHKVTESGLTYYKFVDLDDIKYNYGYILRCKNHIYDPNTHFCIDNDGLFEVKSTINFNEIKKYRVANTDCIDLDLDPYYGKPQHKTLGVRIPCGQQLDVVGYVINCDNDKWYKIKYSTNKGNVDCYVWEGWIEEVPKEPDSTLKYSNISIAKSSYTEGGTNSFSGYISSNYDFSISVKLDGLNKGTKNYSYSASMNDVINNAGIDFAGLDVGNHTIAITASDKKKTLNALSFNFNVDASVNKPNIQVSDALASKKIKISCSTSSAIIYYTLDGSKPNNKSTLYNGEFLINESCIINAVAYKSGKYSSITSQSVNIYYADYPEILCEYTKDGTKVSLKAGSNSTIYYSADSEYIKYSEPFTIVKSAYIYSYATEYGKLNSEIIEEFIDVKEPETPIIALPTSNTKVADGDTAILSWIPIDNASAYEVIVYKNNEQIQVIDDIGTSSISYTFNGVGDYYFKVKAINVIGESNYSQSPIITSIGPSLVRIMDGDNLIHEEYVRYGENANKPSENPSKRGYTFIGWDKSFECITENTVINSLYTINKYTVTFLNQYGEIIGNRNEVEFNNSIDTPDNKVPLEDGYVLIGWKIDSESLDSLCDLEHIDSNMRVTAVVGWEKEDLPVIAYIQGAERDDTNKIGNYKVEVKVKNYPNDFTSALLRVSLKTSENKMVKTENRTISLMPEEENTYTFNFKYSEEYGVSNVEAVVLGLADDGKINTALSKAVSSKVVVRKAYTGEWSDWTEYDVNNPPEEVEGYEYEYKTQYRSQRIEYTQSNNPTLSGWEKYDETVGYSVWNNWTDWSTSYKEENDLTDVEKKTQYKYWRYYGPNSQANGYYWDYYTSNSSYPALETTWMDIPYSQADNGENGWKRFNEVSSPKVMCYATGIIGKSNIPSKDYSEKYYYFTYSSPYNSLAEIRDLYRFRTRNYVYTYYFKKYNEWSDWQDSALSDSEDLNVETRQMYRLRKQEEIEEMNVEDLSGTEYSFSNYIEDVTNYVPNALPSFEDVDLVGRLATVMVYKGKNSDPNESQLQYVGQVEIEENNKFSVTFKTSNDPTYITGDYIVCLAIEGTSGLFNIGLIEAPKTEYCVKFFDSFGTLLSEQKVKEGNNAIIPDAPMHEGYRFIGWSDTSTNVQKNMSIYANEIEETYAIAVVDWENANVLALTAKYGESICDILPGVPETVGNEFLGWKILNQSTGELFDIENGQKVEGNTIVYADYEARKYNVVFYDSKGEQKKELSIQKVNYGESALLPSNPEYDNLLFLGWDSEAQWWNVTSDVDVYPITMYKETTSEPIANLNDYNVGMSEELVLCSEDGAKIYYSLDNNEPIIGENAIEYVNPIILEDDTIINMYSLADNKNKSQTKTIIFVKDKGTEATIESDLIGIETFYPIVSPNEEITLDMNVVDNEGLAAYLFFIECDRSKYYVDQDENAECVFETGELSEDGFIYVSEYAEGYKVLWVGNNSIEEDGNLFSITLKTFSDIEEGAYPIKISYSKSNTIDGDYEKTDPYVNSEFSTDKLVGDVSGDGSVTVADVIKILKYIIGKESFTDTQILLADATGDGKINNTDVVRIARFIIGEQGLR